MVPGSRLMSDTFLKRLMFAQFLGREFMLDKFGAVGSRLTNFSGK
jgi:hypothetical protein